MLSKNIIAAVEWWNDIRLTHSKIEALLKTDTPNGTIANIAGIYNIDTFLGEDFISPELVLEIHKAAKHNGLAK